MRGKGRVAVQTRYFKVGDEWCVVYIPEKPNGFAIMLLGDVQHYVYENETYWLKHPERLVFVEQLLKKGYTIITSHFCGKHWGNDKAFEVARNLYHLVVKQEIINRKIHLIAEGIGGLLALKMMARMSQHIRSVTFINPCLYLYRHYKQEQKHKFFLKQFLRELALAYELKIAEVEEKLFKKNNEVAHDHQLPVQIFHDTSNQRFNFKDHGRCYEIYRKEVGSPIELSLHLPGKPFHYFINRVTKFMQKYERILYR